MKEPHGDTHSDGSFIVYEMEIGQKWAKNARKCPKTPKNAKKSARQFYQNHRADLEKEEDIDRSSNAVSIWNFRFQIEFFGFKVAVRRNNPGLERATSKKSLSGIHLVMRSECASRWLFLLGFSPSRGATEPFSFEQLNLLHFFRETLNQV